MRRRGRWSDTEKTRGSDRTLTGHPRTWRSLEQNVKTEVCKHYNEVGGNSLRDDEGEWSMVVRRKVAKENKKAPVEERQTPIREARDNSTEELWNISRRHESLLYKKSRVRWL